MVVYPPYALNGLVWRWAFVIELRTICLLLITWASFKVIIRKWKQKNVKKNLELLNNLEKLINLET